jgi:hypothetical protein
LSLFYFFSKLKHNNLHQNNNRDHLYIS